MSFDQEIHKLKSNLEDLKKRWPAHSVKPEMVEEMERLEDEISKLTRLKIKGLDNTEAD